MQPPSFSSSDRRQFLRHAALAGGALLTQAHAEPSPAYQIGTFTKFFQHLSYEGLADAISSIGLQGIEAPIRPGGHIEPAQVPDELPKMNAALRERNLDILVMASGINQVSAEQHTESVLRTAAGLGIPRYRMAYYKYDLSRPIRDQLADFRAQLADLVALNKELGIQAVYQNHSGRNYVGAPIWDIYELVQEHDPNHAALAFDIGHATVEGGLSWGIDFSLVQSHLGMIYVKDFVWEGWKKHGVALGEGNVSPDFFKLVRALPKAPPISLHVEYLPRDKNPDGETTKKHVTAIRENLATLKKLLQA